MKYCQLTKEQFLELHEEFSQFLATQQIDVKEWENIKKNKPEIADEELNIFSDVVWEDVLTKVDYLEHVSKSHINLFKCNSKEIIRIYIKLLDESKSFLDKSDFDWFVNNPANSSIDYFKGVKKYSKDRNIELFELIEMGAEISEGNLFNSVVKIID